MAEVEKYLDLITAFHRGKPKFSAMVEAVSQCFVGAQNSYGEMVPAYDLDAAVGVQLDAVGEWVGISRNVRTPLEGVYFSLDVEGLGFEQGVWQGPFDPDTGITSLDDETYRILIRAKIGANHWDGTLESSAAILNSIFSSATDPVPIHANAEPFGTGDGVSSQFQLQYQGRPVYQVESAAIYRNDWQGNQLLYPTPRTNLFAWSSEFTQSYWSKTRTSVAAAAVIGPDGAQAFKLTEDTTANNTHTIARVFTPSGSTTYTLTWTVRAAERRYVRVTVGNFVNLENPNDVNVDLLTGQVFATDANRAVVTMLADGWVRISTTVTTIPTPGNIGPQLALATALSGANVTYTGDGVSGVYVAMSQFEASAFPTGYIPTSALSVTVTDYAVSPTGLITMGQVPDVGASLTWTGDGEIYPAGTYVFIQDNGDMSIDIGIAGERPSAVFLALLTGGYIPIKPEGVRVNYYIVPNVEGPLFGFDVGNQYIAGLDVGVWGDLIQP